MKDLSSILLVDDDSNSLKLYTKLLSELTDARITSTRYPIEALKLAQDNFFDMCLLDITIPFNGSIYGGIDLYLQLRGRYGAHSLLVYSQFITDDLLQRYQCSFNFIERGHDSLKFIDDLCCKMLDLRKQQACFVAIPFSDDYNALYTCINRGILDAKYVPIRLDHLSFTESIIEKMMQQIKDAKVVVFVSTGRNPNTFFECGYSVAQGKEVVMITDYYSNLPFDIRDRNAIAYGKTVDSVTRKLADRLIKLAHVL